MSDPNKLTEWIRTQEKFSYSFEVTQDICEEEIDNLKIDPEPLFFSVTWHAKSHQCKDLNIDPIRTAMLLRCKRKQVLLNMSCDMMREQFLCQVLIMLQEVNIRNLFLCLGEGYDPSTSDFKSTKDMIKFIREKTGTYFCIGIAGFPSCSDEKLMQIKEKVDVGADFILTQAFFDADAFKDLMMRCEKMYIRVPIIPGLFAFETPKELKGFIQKCKIKVSDDLLEPTKSNKKSCCLHIVQDIISELHCKCHIKHFHFFTMNKFQHAIKAIKCFK